MATHPKTNAIEAIKSPITYTFDEAFLNYFGRNGVEAMSQAIAQLNGATNAINETLARNIDKVPVLGDLPLAGRFYRSATQTTNAENANEVAQNNVDKATVAETKVPATEQTNQLPTVNPQKAESVRKVFSITIAPNGRYWLGTNSVDLIKLRLALSQAKQSSSNDTVEIMADANTTFGDVVRVMDLCKELGLSTVTMQTIQPGLVHRNVVSGIGYSSRNQFETLTPATNSARMKVETSRSRQAILSKLERIRFDEVHFDGLPLSEVVKILSGEAKNRDPDKKGINFMINSHADVQLTTAIDPTTGLPANTPTVQTTEPMDISSVAIHINPALTDVRLADLLDAIVKIADKPIKYSVEDYAVVFSAKTPEVAPLYTRFFKVDPNTFYKSLERVSAISFENIPTNHSTRGNGLNFVTRQSQVDIVQATVRAFFTAAGVDLSPPKNLFLNDKQGMLMVRGTLQDLDIVESAVQSLNVAPPQITIEAKFIEVWEQDAKKLWRNLFATRTADTNAWTTILTASHHETLDKELTYGPKDILTAPRVTTLSGRQTRIEINDTYYVRQGINPEALKPPGVSTKSNGQPSLYLMRQQSFGPSLDIIPTVASNGWEIELNVDVTVKEFLGYYIPKNPKFLPVWIDGEQQTVTAPTSSTRTRRLHTHTKVRDGQTLMLGNPLDQDNQIAEKPGDLKQRLIVLITPTILDAAGNPIHSGDEIPPAKHK